jgi:chorismate synthase
MSALLEGIPFGVPIDFDYINLQLRRRQGGYGRGARQQIEKDTAEFVTGVRFGRTIGSPITLIIRNRDFENWTDRMSVTPIEGPPPPIVEARPGHADFAGMLKFAVNDLRPILERSSARNTATLVAAGAVCRCLLRELGIHIFSHVVVLGGIEVTYPQPVDYPALEKLAETSPVRVGDPNAEAEIIAAVDAAGERGDTLGGVFEVVITGCPPGLGSHTAWDLRLDGRLAGAMMGIQAIKGVEIGMGFGVAYRPGSQVHDELFHNPETGFTRSSNNAGGLEGGMTNGEPIVVRAAMKPLSTLKSPLRSVNMETKAGVKAHFERSDVCAVPAAGVIGEAMAAVVLTQAVLDKFGGDSLEELQRNHAAYMESIRSRGYIPPAG